MKRILTAIAAALLLCSCNGNRAFVDLSVSGSADSSEVYLLMLDINRLSIVDTLLLDSEGSVSFKVELPDGDPNFYYLYDSNTDRLASLVLQKGDRVKIQTDAKGNATVEGSDESALLNEADRVLGISLGKFEALSAELLSCTSDSRAEQLKAELARVYVQQKQAALRQVMSNIYSISSIPVLFQQFAGELPVFNEASDAIVFQRVLDSVSTVYPSSKYLASLRSQIDSRSRVLDLQTRIDAADVLTFPEITAPDINGEIRKLTELDGKVIVLIYWSTAQDVFKMFNHELKDLYAEYHDKGLEIYMVGLDIDKTTWANVVRDQELPWINVNDGLGTQSPSLAPYFVQKVPSMYVIGRDGSIPYTDLFDKSELGKAVRSLL